MLCGTSHGNSADCPACVDWGVDRLCDGLDSPSLRILAGLLPPYSTLEVADYTARTLRELGIELPTGSAAIKAISHSYVSDIVEHPDLMQLRLKDLCDLCIAEDYEKSIYDFYLLHWAFDDLQQEPVQWYWHGADRSNIHEIVLERCRSWLHDHDLTLSPS